jgi:hypothetical protein
MIADLCGGFETVHDLMFEISREDLARINMTLTGMFMSINTRKYREGAALYLSRASRPFTAQSCSNLSLFIKAVSS